MRQLGGDGEKTLGAIAWYLPTATKKSWRKLVATCGGRWRREQGDARTAGDAAGWLCRCQPDATPDGHNKKPFAHDADARTAGDAAGWLCCCQPDATPDGHTNDTTTQGDGGRGAGGLPHALQTPHDGPMVGGL